MTKWTFVIIATLSFPSCTKTEQTSARSASVQSGVLVYASQTDFPACIPELAKTIVFSEADNSFFICDGTAYKATTVASANTPSTADEKATLINCPGAAAKAPTPDDVMGQYQINVPENVDPCSVKGYVVGFENELKIAAANDGTYYINNVPPGQNDLIISAGTVALSGLSLTAAPQPLGIRISNALANTGMVTALGKINLPKTGSIAGKVQLNSAAVPDHAGVQIYIPGTSYSALSAADGSFSLANIPAGIHNLFFEKDGFARGQIEGLHVKSEDSTQVSETNLYLDTGEYGSFIVLNSYNKENKSWVNTLDIDLALLPSAGASLMMITLDGNEGRWEPVRTNTTLEYDVQNAIDSAAAHGFYPTPPTRITSPIASSIRARFANNNGLESDTIFKSVVIDYFSDGTKPFVPSFNLDLNTSPLRIEVTDIMHPANADKMHISQGYAYNSEPAFTDLKKQVSIPLKDKIQNCGQIDIFIQFLGHHGKIQTGPRTAIYQDGNEKKIQNKCYSDVAATTSLAVRDSDNGSTFYRSIVTDGEVMIFGFGSGDEFTGASYNPDTNTWSGPISATNGPSARSEFQMLANDSNVFLFGGYNEDQHLYDLHILDKSDRTWKPAAANVPDFPNSWGGGKLVTTTNKLHFFNPVQTYDTDLNDYVYAMNITSYDAASNSWSNSNIAAGVPYRTEPIIVSFEEKVLIVGGKDQNGFSTPTVFFYDPETNSTTALPDLPGNISAYSKDEVFYDVEGSDIYLGRSNSNKVYKYSSGSWSTITLKQNLPYHAYKVLRSGEEFSWYAWNAHITMINDTKEYTGPFVGNGSHNDPTYQRWAYLNESLIATPLKGKGLFLWGGKGVDYSNGQSPTEIIYSDGAIVRTSYADQWTD